MIKHGDCLNVLKGMKDNSVDSLVTDPPAGISFMNKSWDDDKGGRKQWISWLTQVMIECMRVMKPGAHGLVWAIPRTGKGSNTYGEGVVPREFQTDAASGASRFFYCAKASKSDKGKDNTHPTVKSSKLMSYLIRLITPPKGLVLDPFTGSGSTGVAAIKAGFKFLGIEKEKEYLEIANARLEYAKL